MSRFTPLVVALPLALLGSAPSIGIAQSASASEVRAEIVQSLSRWSDAMKRGDAATAASFYAEDAILSFANMEDIRGRTAIQSATQQLMASGTYREVRVDTDQVDLCGDTAYEYGRYHMVFEPRGGTPNTDRGRYIAVWRRQADDSWRMVRDMPISTVPAAH